MSGARSYAVLIIILGLAIMSNSFVIAGPKYHVHVINGLSSSNVLKVHCQSKDDDLGEHALAASAETSWTFRMNILGTTLFWCGMNWASGHGSFKVFWRDDDILGRCNYKECFWIAKDDEPSQIPTPFFPSSRLQAVLQSKVLQSDMETDTFEESFASIIICLFPESMHTQFDLLLYCREPDRKGGHTVQRQGGYVGKQLKPNVVNSKSQKYEDKDDASVTA
ncbi:unnamed protein product [Dovyalis caffra]|uniref:S-protein homolog n=1 Tax=Dovyalis caffra TaxID=77055 RepID=A0AAV1RQM3_9ROSI|nr:unnamed protein product [Dovyalis caffra]